MTALFSYFAAMIAAARLVGALAVARGLIAENTPSMHRLVARDSARWVSRR